MLVVWIVVIAAGEALIWVLSAAIAWYWASGDPYGPARTAAETAALDWIAEQFTFVAIVCFVGLVLFGVARARRAYGLWALGAAQVVSSVAAAYVSSGGVLTAFSLFALASAADVALIVLLSRSQKEGRSESHGQVGHHHA